MHALTSHMTHMNEQTQVFASEAGDKTLTDLQNLGARLVTTDEALARVARS